jgi:hypothetical protein
MSSLRATDGQIPTGLPHSPIAIGGSGQKSFAPPTMPAELPFPERWRLRYRGRIVE